MPRRDAHPGRSHPGAEAPIPNTAGLDHRIIDRWRKSTLLKPRSRRALAQRLRRTANDAPGRHPTPRRLDVSAHDRTAAVREQLLEIADLLELAHDPDPSCLVEISQLLAHEDGPLYDPGVHISELYAALYYIRAGLIASGRRPTDTPTGRQPQPPAKRDLPHDGDHTAAASSDRESHTAIPEVFAEHVGVPTDSPAGATERQLRVLRHRGKPRAGREHARPISPRRRRILVRWLRQTANHATDRDPIRRRRDVLLHYRATAVRTDLLEIAALLEHAHDPDPDCVAALRNLLANGCDSPLYNADIHFSELQATLDHVRYGL